jgi:hypothetical protein
VTAHIRQGALIEFGGMRRIVKTSFMLVAVRMNVSASVVLAMFMRMTVLVTVVVAMGVVRMRGAMLIVALFMPVIVRKFALVFVFMFVSHLGIPFLLCVFISVLPSFL